MFIFAEAGERLLTVPLSSKRIHLLWHTMPYLFIRLVEISYACSMLIRIFIFLAVVLPWSQCKATPGYEFGAKNFPPYMTVDGDKVYGSAVDIIQQVMDDAGISIYFKAYPSKRLNKRISQGKSLYLGSKGIRVYQDLVYYSDLPALTYQLNVYAISPNVLPRDIKGLKGLSVMVIHGYGYGGFIDYLRQNTQLQTSLRHDRAFKMLKAGRTDYVLDYQLPSTRALESVPINNLTQAPLSRIGAYFIVAKSIPNAKQLMNRINTILKRRIAL